MEIVRLPFTTLADGTKTVTSDIKIYGRLYAVQFVDGDLADGVDIVLTSEAPEISIPLITKADFNTDSLYYPRALQHLNTDGTALTTHTMPLVAGNLKAVIAQGGDTKTGAVVCFIIPFDD